MEPKNSVPFTIRAATMDDVSFIFNSWLKSYRDAPAVRSVPNTIYYAEHHATIEKIFASAGLVLLIACAVEEPSQIFGYAVGERKVDCLAIHWIYCKFPFRKFGIGKSLESALLATNVDGHPVQFSHQPKGGEGLLKDRKYIFNPYLLRR